MSTVLRDFAWMYFQLQIKSARKLISALCCGLTVNQFVDLIEWRHGGEYCTSISWLSVRWIKLCFFTENSTSVLILNFTLWSMRGSLSDGFLRSFSSKNSTWNGAQSHGGLWSCDDAWIGRVNCDVMYLLQPKCIFVFVSWRLFNSRTF